MMDFGQAVRLLKQGRRVTRSGWNGKGMFVYYVPAASYPAQRNTAGTMIGMFPDDMVPYRDYLAMKTAQGDVVPWVASQSDILADDWERYPDVETGVVYKDGEPRDPATDEPVQI